MSEMDEDSDLDPDYPDGDEDDEGRDDMPSSKDITEAIEKATAAQQEPSCDFAPTRIGPGVERIVARSKSRTGMWMRMEGASGEITDGPLSGRTFHVSGTFGVGGMDMFIDFDVLPGDDMPAGRDRFMVRGRTILQEIITLLTDERRLHATIRHALGPQIKLHYIGEVVPENLRDASGQPIEGLKEMTAHRGVYVALDPATDETPDKWYYIICHESDAALIGGCIEHTAPPGDAWTLWSVP
jgi:hypothetical protein